ncbi:DUF4244 domain-containing protein [Wenjunlia tyrosinilytica]|uniref:DUF4244 domain-containing protein n=1 Tax=Wenjunlia tyrosinilytica TaxID=1544741 RepID=A0A917ZQ46_9ACTN|nr:DUF4244 domain-containing protein [Wenjunlia tyrosinilytica]GGO89313.1 hypothetical protein GCM10012280_32120 [Wenjunlia tyrosinilytica]
MRVLRALRGRLTGRLGDSGMTTAEYALGTMAAMGFASVLYKIVKSPAISTALSGIVERALNATF